MKKREKIIGSIIILVLAIVFLSIGYITTSHKEMTKEEMESMFVEADASKDEEKSKVNVGSKTISLGKDTKVSKSVTNKEPKVADNNTESNINSNNSGIYVEIKGQVTKPDVYKMQEGNIVNDLIEMAGGITSAADISQINRAGKLINNQCLVIPKKGEKITSSINQNQNQVQGQSGESSGKQIININTATKEELKKLSGIGDSKADKIIKYREDKGLFKNIEDIKNVSGIGESTFNNLKDQITIN